MYLFSLGLNIFLTIVLYVESNCGGVIVISSLVNAYALPDPFRSPVAYSIALLSDTKRAVPLAISASVVPEVLGTDLSARSAAELDISSGKLLIYEVTASVIGVGRACPAVIAAGLISRPLAAVKSPLIASFTTASSPADTVINPSKSLYLTFSKASI